MRPMGYLPEPKRGLGAGWIALIVVGVLGGLSVLGFVGMVFAYAMLHSPPHAASDPVLDADTDAGAPGTK